MDIALSRRHEPNEITAVLSSTMPKLTVRVEALEDVSKHEQQSDIHLVVVEGVGAYPAGIDVFAFPGSPDERIYAALARLLATALNCDALSDGTPYVLPGMLRHPYWSLLWRNGEAWLADDAHSDAYDNTGGPVRLVARLEHPLPAIMPDGSIQDH